MSAVRRPSALRPVSAAKRQHDKAMGASPWVIRPPPFTARVPQGRQVVCVRLSPLRGCGVWDTVSTG